MMSVHKGSSEIKKNLKYLLIEYSLLMHSFVRNAYVRGQKREVFVSVPFRTSVLKWSQWLFTVAGNELKTKPALPSRLRY